MSKTRKAHIKLTLQFAVTIDETSIPVEADKDEREYNERQKRLFQAILSDPENLATFLRYQVASEMGGYSWQDWDELILGYEDSNGSQALAPAIAALNQEDQDFFREAEESRLFSENTDDALGCFSTGLQEAKFEVVEDER